MKNFRLGKCLVGEMSDRGSVLAVKVGEMSGRGNVRLGNCLVGELSVGELSVGELSIGDLSSGKCPSGKCLVGEMSGYPLDHLTMAFYFKLVHQEPSLKVI